MTKKKLLFAALLVAALPTVLTAWTIARERIWIQNDLDSPVSVYCEFLYKDGNTGQRSPEHWYQMLAGGAVECESLFETGVRETFGAGETIRLLSYFPGFLRGFPTAEIALETLAVLSETPLEEKLRGIFKTLVVTDADGRTLLTLDDFSRAKVTRQDRLYTIVLDESLYE